jgi:hypothetical protein
MNIIGSPKFGNVTNDRKTRVAGKLLRRVSMVMKKPRPSIETISNNYEQPDNPGATLPDGMFLNYTPTSDDSIIRVKVGCYLYRGGSASDGTSVRNDYMMFRYMWQFGDEAMDYQFHREYDSDGYRFFKTEIPSWGKGKQKPIRWRVVNYSGSGYFRTNIYYNNGFTASWNQRFDGDKCFSLMPQICVEEYSATEPSESPVMVWDANNVDY